MRAIPGDGHAAPRFRWLLAAENGAAGILHSLAFRPYAAVIALSFLCCILFLPGIAALPVTDRDEARFAQASKQMLETGDFIDIRLQDKPRHKKPAGIYWLQAASVAAAETAGAALNDIWAYRIPSFLGALAAVLLTFWAGRAIIGRESALIAAALFASCLMLSFEARIAKADAALIATIALAQGALFRLYMAPAGSATRGLAALFWLGLGAGILIKGPPAPAIAMLTCAAVLLADRRRAWLRNLHWRWGVLLLLAVTLPWLIAIGISSNGDFFRHSVGQDFAGKLHSTRETHGGLPGFYLLAFLWTFWPATLFVTGGTIRTLWTWRRSRRLIFLAAWIVPFWLAIEAIPTKLPHYALPFYPAIAMAAAFGMRRGDRQRSRIGGGLWGIAALAQIAILFGLAWTAEAPQSPWFAIALAAAAGAAALTVSAAFRAYRTVALFGTLLTGVLFYGAGFGGVLPAFEPVWITGKASAAARSLKGCGNEPPGFAGLDESSLVFLNGTNTLLGSAPGLAEALASNKARAAFVSWKSGEDFERVFEEKTGHAPSFLGCVDGIGLNGQGPLRLLVYARPGTATLPGCKPAPAFACRNKAAVRWRRLLDTAF